MITDGLMADYDREGYAILEQVIPPASLGRVQQSYEETIEAALSLGLAPRDEATGFLQGHRFQNPHHPSLARRPLMEALGAPAILAFARQLCGEDAAMHGVAAFAMNEEFDYRSSWHRDSYFAWGKDSPTERRLREIERLPATQVLVALEDDASFWYVPGSHNRANTAEEEEGYDEALSGWDAETVRPGALQVRLRAGSAAPFDARGDPPRDEGTGPPPPVPVHHLRRRRAGGGVVGGQRLGAGSGVRGSSLSRLAARAVPQVGGEDHGGCPRGGLAPALSPLPPPRSIASQATKGGGDMHVHAGRPPEPGHGPQGGNGSWNQPGKRPRPTARPSCTTNRYRRTGAAGIAASSGRMRAANHGPRLPRRPRPSPERQGNRRPGDGRLRGELRSLRVGYPPMAGHSQEKAAAVTRAYSRASKSCLTCWDHGRPNQIDSRTRPQP